MKLTQMRLLSMRSRRLLLATRPPFQSSVTHSLFFDLLFNAALILTTLSSAYILRHRLGLLYIMKLIVYLFEFIYNNVGNNRMVEIASYISEGLIAFFRTMQISLSTLVLVFLVNLILSQNQESAGCYCIRAMLSALTASSAC
eukprot:IDg10332t1